jgi:thiamine-phosphate pyrophosphorylase
VAERAPDFLRLIDANANRAREGIRTAEDYIRFEVGHTPWAARLKNIRRSITEIVQRHFTDPEVIASRNVAGDPGKPGEGDLHSAESSSKICNSQSVAQRGLKRAQEALRVLEEYFRSEFPKSSGELERHRYSLYEAEQWLVLASEAAGIIGKASVYVLLTEAMCPLGLTATARAALKGGCKLLQLREKVHNDKNLLAKARDLRIICSEHNAVLICNDRLDLARLSRADGVHVGQDDLAPEEIRKVAGASLVVGRSTHSIEQAQRAVEIEKADYVAIGSMYVTSTKREHILAGVEVAEKIAAMRFDVPIFAIGGITLDRVPELKRAGIKGVAISSAIISERDPETATRRFVDAMTP